MGWYYIGIDTCRIIGMIEIRLEKKGEPRNGVLTFWTTICSLLV